MSDSPNPDRRSQAIFCRDMEETAELYNDGYQAAMQHKTGGAEHRAWLIQVAEQEIRHLVEDEPADPYLYLDRALLPVVATNIADAVLAEIDFDLDGQPDDRCVCGLRRDEHPPCRLGGEFVEDGSFHGF